MKRALVSVLGVQPSTTMNADEAVARGAALQSAILSPRFKVLPYEIQESQPYPIKLSWDEDSNTEPPAEGEAPTNSVIMFDRGLSFPIVRRVTLKREGDFVVNASYDASSTQYGFSSDLTDVCSFKIKAAAGALNKVRVNVKQDIHGIIQLSSAQMVEEIEDEETAEAKKEEGDKKDGGDEPKEKKKKLKKTTLEDKTTRPLDWTKAEIESHFEAEVSMANVDRVVQETSDMRNELESYIYDMRDKIVSDNHLAPYASEEEKSSFSADLESTENWLYEDGFDAVKSVYADKLADLKKTGGPIEQRQKEAAARPGAVSNLQRSVEHYKTWLNDSQTNEKFAHITDEERQKGHTKCDEVSSWMYEKLDKQGSLPLHADPAVTCAEIAAKTSELAAVCAPIMNKPAPKPKKEEKKEEPKAAEEKTAEKKEEEPKAMDVEEEGEKATEEGAANPTEPMQTD